MRSNFSAHRVAVHSSSAPVVCRLLGGASLVASLLWCAVAGATPGTNAPIVSTWDTASSSVVGAFTSAFFSGGHLDFVSYNANFSSTSSNISAQFGMHYVNYVPSENATVLDGFSGTAAFVYLAPVMPRWGSGLPKLAFGFYIGAAPTVLMSLSGGGSTVTGTASTDFWAPLSLGLALPSAPSEHFSLVPWIEGSVGITAGASGSASNLTLTSAQAASVLQSYQSTGTLTIPSSLLPTTSTSISAAADLRAGLLADIHIGRAIDLGATGMVGNLGSGFTGPFAVFLGGRLAWHWDDVVPAALTPKERLSWEHCEDIEEAMKQCGSAKASGPAAPGTTAPAKSTTAPSAASAPNPAAPAVAPPAAR
jgi:hypothetical protein